MMTPILQSVCLVVACALLSSPVMAQSSIPAPSGSAWEYPLIKDYGKIRPYPDSKIQPDPQKEYKVLFNITRAGEAKDRINPGFEQVARLLNLFTWAGVPTAQLKVAVVVHGEATPAVLDNPHYREKFQIDNPNTELIKKLKDTGVVLYVCGQALAHSELKPDWVNPQIEVALAALTVLPIYQMAGYALIPE